mmetsp:Transcript_27024/g.40375  ORF Transcript_27024/g.40375 Transcript_27024/m.40375 type:complete len:181 (-) Transcript_27024:117-659(-)
MWQNILGSTIPNKKKKKSEKGSGFTQPDEYKKLVQMKGPTSSNRFEDFQPPKDSDAKATELENHEIDARRGLDFEHHHYMHPHNGFAIVDVRVRELRFDNANPEDTPFLVLVSEKVEKKKKIESAREGKGKEKMKPQEIIFQMHSKEAHGAMKRRLEATLKIAGRSNTSTHATKHQRLRK